MRTILVTGGAGFIGSNLAQALCARDTHRIVVCDALGTGEKWRNLLGAPIADFVAPSDLFDWLALQPEAPETIVHFGSHASSTETDAGALVASNHTFSSLLWRWATEHGSRFLYASSFGVYGNGEHGFADGEDLAAMAQLRPVHPQGWSKLLFDRFAATEALGGRAPSQWAGLRFFNVYGPNEAHKGDQRSVIHKAYPNALHDQPVKLYRAPAGNPPMMRDFIHVDDAIAVTLWLLDHPEISGIYNVGTGVARSFEDMAHSVFAALGKAPHIKPIEMPSEVERIYQYHAQADLTRLRAAGYEGEFRGLEKGVKDYLAHLHTGH